MLILSRKTGETITIGDDVKVTLVDVNLRTGHCRIGIDAPKNVMITRDDMICKEKKTLTDKENRVKITTLTQSDNK